MQRSATDSNAGYPMVIDSIFLEQVHEPKTIARIAKAEKRRDANRSCKHKLICFTCLPLAKVSGCNRKRFPILVLLMPYPLIFDKHYTKNGKCLKPEKASGSALEKASRALVRQALQGTRGPEPRRRTHRPEGNRRKGRSY